MITTVSVTRPTEESISLSAILLACASAETVFAGTAREVDVWDLQIVQRYVARVVAAHTEWVNRNAQLWVLPAAGDGPPVTGAELTAEE